MLTSVDVSASLDLLKGADVITPSFAVPGETTSPFPEASTEAVEDFATVLLEGTVLDSPEDSSIHDIEYRY